MNTQPNDKLADGQDKIHLNDIIDGVEMREQAILIVGDKKYWADRTTKDKLATHADCEDCGVEFKKNYTFQRLCTDCQTKGYNQRYLKLPLVKWDGESMLVTYGDDQYFSDPDEALEYCEDNKINPSDIQLVVCVRTSFSQIDICELQQDNVHEDWEPSEELCRLTDQLNEYLSKASTGTWIEGNNRINLADYDNEKEASND